MKSEHLALIGAVLRDMGYETETTDDDRVLAENATRVVMAVAFDGVVDLLEGWEDHQSWLVELARLRLSVDKSWELFLVLACRVSVDDSVEIGALQGVRRDANYARKLVLTDLERASLTRIREELAPLEDLPLPTDAAVPDALILLKSRAEQEGEEDVLRVLEAYRTNLPPFEGL